VWAFVTAVTSVGHETTGGRDAVALLPTQGVCTAHGGTRRHPIHAADPDLRLPGRRTLEPTAGKILHYYYYHYYYYSNATHRCHLTQSELHLTEMDFTGSNICQRLKLWEHRSRHGNTAFQRCGALGACFMGRTSLTCKCGLSAFSHLAIHAKMQCPGTVCVALS